MDHPTNTSMSITATAQDTLSIYLFSLSALYYFFVYCVYSSEVNTIITQLMSLSVCP